MKKLDAGSKIILISFGVLCVSWLLWFWISIFFLDTENIENRNKAEFPKLTKDKYEVYAKEFETFYNDNIPFRNDLITMNSAIDFFVFGRSSNTKVVLGENDWLFYNSISDGHPIANYQGKDLYSEEELMALADNCIKQRDFLAEQGKEFVILIIPNKERIYCENMPKEYGEPADVYGTKQVVEYLEENTDIRIVYAYDELMDAKTSLDENIYYRTDTHWNDIGGYVGANVLLSELGIDMPSINELEIKADKYADGDLVQMLSLKEWWPGDDYIYTIDGYDKHDMEILHWDENADYTLKARGADERRLYVIRDSFSTIMCRYVGSQFNDSRFMHKYKYSYEDFVDYNPDVVVYETVERYVNSLSTFSIK